MYSESGRLVFSKSQTDNRFALCKAALCPTRIHTIRLKAIYEDTEDIEKFAINDFDELLFNRMLVRLSQIAWGGVFTKYDLDYSPEGAFYPFVRFSGRGYKPIDTGAIWIGARHCYPRIFVDNGVANWVEPYSRSGIVMTEPFEPYANVRQNMRRLANKAIYPMLELDQFL
jgi:hypothetical protein